MTVRIGFLGTGYMGQLAHLDNFRRVPGCDVVALAEVRRELGRKVSAYYDVPVVYGSHAELLADERVDAIGGKSAPRFTSRKVASKSSQPLR